MSKGAEQVHWAELPEIMIVEPLNISSPRASAEDPPTTAAEPAPKTKRSFLPWKRDKSSKT
jgi:hypothetical protein